MHAVQCPDQGPPAQEGRGPVITDPEEDTRMIRSASPMKTG